MVEQVPSALEYGLYGYLGLVASIGLYAHARIWRLRRRQRLRSIDEPTRSD